MNKLLCGWLLFCSGIISGCSSEPTVEQLSDVKLPAKWNNREESTQSQEVSWWKNFNDLQLNALIDQALLTNNDFAAAAIRVHRAQLQAGLVDTNLTPTVTIAANTGVTNTYNPQVSTRNSSASLSMSYELDLWGKLSNQREAAYLELQATKADCQAFALSLTGTTAQLYWQLAYLNQLLTLNTADLDSAEKTLSIAQTKYDVGAYSELDTAQAEMNLSNQQAFHTQLVQQRIEARHALAILFNQPPEADVVDPQTLPDLPMPTVNAGIPAEILANRPDMFAAEKRLRESLLNIDITRKSFYPIFSLTGSLGAASTELTNLSQNPFSTVAAALTLPFFQLNTTLKSIGISRTQYEEAVVNFRQRLYSALAEVENSLSARSQLLEEGNKLKLSKLYALRAESISHTRYEEGYSDILLWLNAQASLRNAERSVILNRLNQLNNQVNLYKALGLGSSASKLACNQNNR